MSRDCAGVTPADIMTKIIDTGCGVFELEEAESGRIHFLFLAGAAMAFSSVSVASNALHMKRYDPYAVGR